MSDFNIEVEGGSRVRLLTGGKYCPNDIIVTSRGGAANNQDKTITENGVYTADEGYTGLGTVTVDVQSTGGGEIDALIDGTITEVSSGVTSIGQYALAYRSQLTSASFPNATSIGNSAFFSCSALTSVDFPNVTSIGNDVFNGCKVLESVSLPNVASIGNKTFYACYKLNNADFPSATSIGSNAFFNCSALKSVYFPDVTSIGTYAFENCGALASIDFPSATSIGEQAFKYCYALKNASFPNATSIGRYAFNECRKLASAEFPKAQKVTQYMFFGCFLLESADFPEAKSIETYSFSACRSLKSVILRSETVCTLATTTAFNNCTHILGTVDSTYNPNGDKDGYIYVPANLVDSYKSATNWSTYASQIVAIPGEESTKLPTPTIMVDVGDLYINDISNATSVSIYWRYEGEETWNLLVEHTIAEGTEQDVLLSSVISGLIGSNGFLPGDSVTLSVIAHADGYEDSERSNEVTFTVPYS